MTLRAISVFIDNDNVERMDSKILIISNCSKSKITGYLGKCKSKKG
jgi:hypothetical protein